MRNSGNVSILWRKGDCKMKNSLVKNSVYNVLYNILNIIFQLLASTYAARIIHANGVGEVAYAQNIEAYFVTIAMLGIPNYGVREIAKYKENDEETNKVFCELTSINIISTTICIVLYNILISYCNWGNNKALMYAVEIELIFNYLNVDWFYQGKEEFEYIAKRSLVVKIMSLVAIYILVKDENDIVVYALIYAVAIGINNIINIIHLKKYRIKLVKKNISMKRHIKSIAIMLGSVVAINLYTMLDTTMLGFMTDNVSVGYYTSSMKTVKMIIIAITAIGGALLPRLSYYHTSGMEKECSEVVNVVFSAVTIIFAPCVVGIFLTADIIMPVMFGSTFVSAGDTLKILSFLICVLGISNLFGTQVLLTYGQEKKLLICTLIGAISNVLMNLMLIPRFEQNGAAIASVISETLVAIMSYVYSKKYVRIRIEWKYVVDIIGALVLMAVLVKIELNFSLNNYVKLVLAISVGVLSYILMWILLGRKEIKKFIGDLRHLC